MSGKDTGKVTGAEPNGSAKGAQQRTHHDGSAGRAFTAEQKLAVIRVRKCGTTAFYDILGLEAEKTTVDDAGIKKAYRRQSLLTHPDKNGYEGAAEAFKMVSRAFQVLSDPDKRKRYDQFGGDPDNRFSSASASSPFSGFARSPGGRAGPGGGMWEEEISPEELFRQFFGGGLGGGFGSPLGGGMFDTGPGFVFNFGGGPGFRVHQFGGARPRRRPAGAQGRQNGENDTPTAGSALQSLLPLLILFLIPLLSSLLSSSGGPVFSAPPKVPAFNLDIPEPPLTQHRVSSTLGVTYYVNPADVSEFSKQKWQQLDKAAESRLFGILSNECDVEVGRRDAMMRQAQGWFLVDYELINRARSLELKSCNRLRRMGFIRN